MKKIAKLFALFIYWCLSIQGIQYLINYPQDITFYLALGWLTVNVYFTYYLFKKTN